MLIVHNFNCPVNVVGYDPSKGIMNLNYRTVLAAVAYDCPVTGEVFMIEVHQAIFIHNLNCNILCPMKMRMYDDKVNDIPKYLTDNPTDQTHSIFIHEIGETLLIPLHLHGVTPYFTFRESTMEEYNNFTHFSATAVDPEWDPHDTSFSDQEDTLLTTGGLLRDRPEEFRGDFVAGMHSNTCKYLQEWGNVNLENVLTGHIIFPVLGYKTQPRCNPYRGLC